MVLRTCVAILRDRHDAEDATQATFLVLARKAPFLSVRDSIGPWLFGVAHRVAFCAPLPRSAAVPTSSNPRGSRVGRRTTLCGMNPL